MTAAHGAVEDHHVQYAGFGLRFTAGFVDLLVFLPLFGLGFWAMDTRPAVALAYSFLGEVAYFAYAIVGHAKWGQTLGKRAVGIRVLDLSGRRIGWRQAVRRSSVDIVLGTVAQAAYWATLWNMPELRTLPWPEAQLRYETLRPGWVVGIDYVYNAWLASEIVSVLFNRRRRALHDFIAGTVVVVEPQRRTAAAAA